MTIAMTVIGGYLGAGKTTLLNRILTETDEPVAVVVNDFGSINIDASLVDSADERTIALTNGCVCCSLTDGLVDALSTVSSMSPPPARLVIETSGVADPATVAAYGDTTGFHLDAVLVVADASLLEEQIDHHLVGALVSAQLQAADLLLVNKSDLVDPVERRALHARLDELVPDVARIETVNAEVPLETVIGVEREASGELPIPAFEGAGPQWRTWVNRAEKPLSRDQIGALVESFPPGVVRAKGVVQLDEDLERQWIFQLVGGRWSMTEGDRWTGRRVTEIVVIAADSPVP